MARKIRKCPACGHGQLSIIEVHEEIGATDYGAVEVTPHGLIAPSVFEFEAGDPLTVHLACGCCGHYWQSRLPVSHTKEGGE